MYPRGVISVEESRIGVGTPEGRTGRTHVACSCSSREREVWDRTRIVFTHCGVAREKLIELWRGRTDSTALTLV